VLVDFFEREVLKAAPISHDLLPSVLTRLTGDPLAVEAIDQSRAVGGTAELVVI
jgi:hypothetical protein